VFDLLAGSFAVVSKAMGGVDAVVNLGINTIDVAYSVGDFLDRFYLLLREHQLVSLLLLDLSQFRLQIKAEPLTLNFRALLGGSMLGDNLSMISDTTIAATQSLDVI
jgi:Na+/H+ antiporter NhaC